MSAGELSSEAKKEPKVDHKRFQGQNRSSLFTLKSLATILFLLISFLLFFSSFRSSFYKRSQQTSHLRMHQYKAILYHTNWANYGRNFQVKDIPIQGVTDIAYAFFNLRDAGNGNWEIVSGDTYTLS